MICSLIITESPQKNLWAKPTLEMEETDGLTFKVVRCEKHLLTRKSAYKRIWRLAGEDAPHMLCPPLLPKLDGKRKPKLPDYMEAVFFPKQSIKTERIQQLKEALMKKNVMDFFRKNNAAAGQMSVVLIDFSGRYADYVPLLVNLCGTVKIYTKNRRYEALCEKIMEEQGAAVTVSDQPSCLSGCDAAIAPGGVAEELPIDGKTVLFTTFLACAQRGRVYDKHQPQIPKRYLRLMDTDIDLYEAVLHLYGYF